MMTQTHLIVAGAFLAKPKEPMRNIALIIGAVLPDIIIFYLVFWARVLNDVPHSILWSKTYFSEPWTFWTMVGNSFPLYACIGAIGFILFKAQHNLRQIGLLLMIISAAALLHIALDFPVHADDAHAHFYPLTDWRFFSPISYWDGRYHSDWVRIVELCISILGIVFLFKRFISLWVRCALGVLLAAYIAVPLYFSL